MPTPPTPKPKPKIFVYVHNPISSIECSDAIYEVLKDSGLYDVKFIGPDAFPVLPLTPENLSGAALFVMGGGSGNDSAFPSLMGRKAQMIRDYVSANGRFLGICMGAYVAAKPYLNLVAPDTRVMQYISRPQADVLTDVDTVLTTFWNGVASELYFQDGPCFGKRSSSPSLTGTVVARYTNNDIAALIQPYGVSGKIGLVGPHPEAARWWFYTTKLIKNKWYTDLRHDLILSFVAQLLS
jgi:glutamine amidotransferase-like uncharacterized protein